MATRAAKTTAKKTATPAKRATAPRARKTAAKKTAPPRLSLVKAPSSQLTRRPRPFMTDVQGYATLAARLVGINTPSIRDWRDHRNQTATRPLRDGSLLHYNLDTRTLTWQAICPMGATHIYRLTSPSTAAAARVHADRCTEAHATFTHIPRLTPDEWAALGIHTGPTWARKDAIGEEQTVSIPVPLPDTTQQPEPEPRALADQLAHSGLGNADTQPISTDAIAAHIADQTPKEHPQP